MELLEQQLILERDIKQLQQDNSRLQDKNDRLKKESLSILELIEKQKKTLKSLEEEAVKEKDRIRDEKIAWESQKREEEYKVQQKELAATKILNREDFVRSQEQKLAKKEVEVKAQAQANAEVEKGFAEREVEVQKKELEVKKNVEASQKVTSYAKEALEKVKLSIIKEVNSWEIK